MAKVRRAQILWQGENGQYYTLTLDASVRETHTGSNTVTDHPVELGSNIADHSRPDPDQLSMEARISNTPHFLPADHMGGVTMEDHQVKGAQITASREVAGVPLAGGVFGVVGSLVPLPTHALGQTGTGRFDTAVVSGFSGSFDRVQECYKELTRLRTEGVLCRVLTTLRAYNNMLITQLEPTRDAHTGNTLAFTITFKNVRFGTTKNEAVPKIPVEHKEKGAVTKHEHEEDEDSTSLLNLMVNRGR
jgi:hypothetical protein